LWRKAERCILPNCIAKLKTEMSIATLYFEELRATMRGRFAWVGTGVILLAVGCVATVGTQDTWLDGYGIIAYFLVPLAFVPLAAVFLASPRANRFVESVFTAPVERRDWFVAKILVLLTLAAAYYVALVPMVLVYTHHVGVPLLLQKLLIWAPCLLLVSIAMGALIGVMFIGESIAAPAATGMGVLLVYAGFVPLQELLVAQGNGATRTGHLTLVSPAVLLKNVFGFTLAVGSIPATTTWTWISLATVVIVAFALAGWAFLRAQGVETWEASRSQRWIIALGILAIKHASVRSAIQEFAACIGDEDYRTHMVGEMAVRLAESGQFGEADSLAATLESSALLKGRDKRGNLGMHRRYSNLLLSSLRFPVRDSLQSQADAW
jgi:hypothetical protein